MQLRLHWLLLLLVLPFPCFAERGYVVVFVEDANHLPVRGIEIGIQGIEGSGVTKDDGKVRLAVGNDVKAAEWLTLFILHSPPGKDLAIFSPYDFRAEVPSFEDKPDNFLTVSVMQRGDRAALENGEIIASIVKRIINLNAPKPAGDPDARQDSESSLVTVAKQCGDGPGEVDQAIRNWSKKASDPYEVGLAALYERNFPKASSQLQDSLQQREVQRSMNRRMDDNQVADAAYFLGWSLYQEGKYEESAEAYLKCLEVRPDDAAALNNAGLGFMLAGDLAKAERYFYKAQDINSMHFGKEKVDENGFPLTSPAETANLSNEGVLMRRKGEYSAAESTFRLVIRLDEETLGMDDPNVAIDLNNLAFLLTDMALQIDTEEEFRDAVDPSIAIDLSYYLPG